MTKMQETHTPHPQGTFGVTVLGSGSSGNASVIHAPGGKILVDAGFTSKELHSRLDRTNIKPSDIKAILITHEHQDHIRGCRVFADKYDITTYLTLATFNAASAMNMVSSRKSLFSAGSAFELSGVRVEPFSIPHDTEDTVGFVFSANGMKIGLATDLGHLNMLALQKLKNCNALILESNHDVGLLRNSPRPLHLKRRILSRHGHLSNEDALKGLEELIWPEMRYLILAHLSSECNNHELLQRLASERLANFNRQDILLKIAEQTEPSETFWLY